jgi:hypothetical protein
MAWPGTAWRSSAFFPRRHRCLLPPSFAPRPTSSQLFPASPEVVVRFPPRDSIDAMDARGEDLSGAMRSRTEPA